MLDKGLKTYTGARRGNSNGNSKNESYNKSLVREGRNHASNLNPVTHELVEPRRPEQSPGCRANQTYEPEAPALGRLQSLLYFNEASPLRTTDSPLGE